MADLFDVSKTPGDRVQKSAFLDRPSRKIPARRPASDTRPAPARRGWPSGLGNPVAVYEYRDPSGTLLYEIGRFETPDGSKTFRGRTPVPGRPGWWHHALPADRVLYRLPDLAPAIAAGATVYLTEGEKDADALAELGAVATTKPNGAIKQPDEWRPEWTAALAGAHLVIVADRDDAGYRHAAAVRDALGDAPKSLRIVRTPLDVAKGDVSDHLAAGRTLAELEPVPAELLTATAPARPAPSPRPAREPGRVVAGPWPARDGGPGGDGGDPPAPLLIVRDEYLADDAGLYKLGPVKRGQAYREARELLNVRVRLARRVRRDMGDGSRPVVSHVDLSASRGQESADVTAVETRDFESLAWVADLPWSDVAYRRTSSGRSDVINAITRTSGDVPVVTAYGTLGWRMRPDGSWMYVHAAGAIDAAGPVAGTRVDIPADLHCYALPDPPTAPDEIRAAVHASVMILATLPRRISAPLLGAAYRALLGESSTTVFLLGTYGTGKSGLSALMLQHSAPSVRHDRLPIPAGEDATTITAIEELRFIAGHVPFVADDLAPDRGADRSATRANVLVRSQHNRTGKLRGKRDGGTRPHHHPRGLLVLTGEDGASSPSAENRILYVPLRRGDVDIDLLAELETDADAAARGTLAAAMVRWAAGRMDGMADWVRRERATLSAALRTPGADPGPDARRADAAADLAVGWRAMLTAAVELGALTQPEADDLWDMAWSGLIEAKSLQTTVTAARSLPERAADALRSALVAGRAHLAQRDGATPPAGTDTRRWGWTPAAGLVEARPVGACVGWVSPDGATVWLEVGSTMATLEAQSRAEGDPLRTTSRALGGALADAGLLLRTDRSGQLAIGGFRAGGGQHRVWELPIGWLFPAEGDGATLAEAAPAAPTPAPVPPVAATDAEMQKSVPVEQEAPADEPEPESVPARAVATAYRAPAAVVDVDRAYLAAPAGPVELPDPPDTLAALLLWAEGALGTRHEYARHDAGQVWLTPGAAARYGLPAERPAESAADTLAAARDLAAAGWQTGKGGLSRWWVRAFRPGGRTVHLAVVPWVTAADCPLVKGDPAAGELADRIAAYGRHVGVPWQMSSGVTGIRLLELSRARTPIRVTAPSDPPPPCRRGRSDVPEVDLLWQRQPSPDEAAAPWLHAYDLNAMYLAAASSVRVGLGDAEHRQAPTFDPSLPGYWRITPPDWQHARLPDPFDPSGRGRRGPVWLTTPSLAALVDLGWWDGDGVSEAYVWPTIATRQDGRPAGRIPGARYLEHWYTRLRTARTARTAETGGQGDPVLTAIKATYAHGIGRLDADTAAGQPLHRPDWRHHLIGTARSNLLRKLAAVAEQSGRYPLAIATDCVLYAAADPDIAAACPVGLPFDPAGVALGAAKPAGTAAMSDVLPLLSRGTRPDRSKLMTLFDGED